MLTFDFDGQDTDHLGVTCDVSGRFVPEPGLPLLYAASFAALALLRRSRARQRE